MLRRLERAGPSIGLDIYLCKARKAGISEGLRRPCFGSSLVFSWT